MTAHIKFRKHDWTIENRLSILRRIEIIWSLQSVSLISEITELNLVYECGILWFMTVDLTMVREMIIFVSITCVCTVARLVTRSCLRTRSVIKCYNDQWSINWRSVWPCQEDFMTFTSLTSETSVIIPSLLLAVTNMGACVSMWLTRPRCHLCIYLTWIDNHSSYDNNKLGA